MPKATRKLVFVSHTSANTYQEDFNDMQEPPSKTYTSVNELQEEFDTTHESGPDQEVFF